LKDKIIITGTSGYIGKNLLHFFVNNNFRVVALVRTIPIDSLKINNVDYFIYNLSNKLDITIFENALCVIHCAYDFKNPFNNYIGTINLLNITETLGSRFIFLSTLSANENTDSNYAKTKFILEEITKKYKKTTILRLGLVIGNGGFYGKLQFFAHKFRIIPLINDGQQIMQTLKIADLNLIIFKTIKHNINGYFNIAINQKRTFKDLFDLISIQDDKKLFYIPIPNLFVLFLLNFFNHFKIYTSFTVDNLNSLNNLKFVSTLDSEKVFNYKFS
jgi:nucleoside-diphosphate-sugar epimerase